MDENDTIKAISITGAGPIKPTEIKKLLHIGPKSVYNFVQLSEDVVAIQKLYQSQGYSAIFAPDTGPDAKRPGVLNLLLVVARVAEIKITGNHWVKSQVILREMKTRVGDYFNVDRRRLFRLNLFDEVEVTERPLGPSRIGLTINVTERTPSLIKAIFNRDPDEVKTLLAKGTDPNAQVGMNKSIVFGNRLQRFFWNLNDETPLICAILAFGPEPIADGVHYFERRQTSYSDSASATASPLLKTAEQIREGEQVSKQIVSLLLGAGARINTPDGMGRTPLMAAVAVKKEWLVRLLLTVADVNARDKQGNTALSIALKGMYMDADIIDLLRAHGAKEASD